MTTEYKELDINLLDEHPDNPRLFYRDEVIDSIVHEVELRGKEVFANDKAISVAPRNKRFVIYKGHHRYIAAKNAKLDMVYCWIDTDITDDELFIELLLDNNQADLMPLERGKHAFTHTEKYHKAKGDVPSKSISAYAKRIGKAQNTVSENKSAYEVYEHCRKSISREILLRLLGMNGGKDVSDGDISEAWTGAMSSKHFRFTHSVPKKHWTLLVESVLKYHWNTNDLELRVKSINDVLTIPEYLNKWMVPKKIIAEVIKDPKLGEKYKRLGEVAKECYDKLSEKITLYNIKDEYEENEEAEKIIYHPRIEFVNKLKKKKTDKIKDTRKSYGEILEFIKKKKEHYKDFLKRETDKEEREKQELKRKEMMLELQQQYEPDLFNQDCLDMTEEQVQDNSVDLIITDPPYGVSDGSFTFHAGKEASVVKGEWDKKENLPPLKDWINLCSQKLKPGGNLFICSTFHNLFEVGYEIQKHEDLKLIQYIGWQSKNPAPIFIDDRFGYIFEIVIFARKNGKVNYFDRDAITDTQGRKQVGNYWILDTVPHGKERIHPTQKPEELSDRIIKCACPEDGLVLDMFSGGGTFLVSAKKNLRRSVGFEKDEKIYKQAVNRIEKIEITIEDEKIKFDNNKQSTKKIDKIDNYIS